MMVQVRIYSRTFDKAQHIAEEYGCIACRTSQEAVEDADVIITATTSKTPVVNAEWVKDGVHINSKGFNCFGSLFGACNN